MSDSYHKPMSHFAETIFKNKYAHTKEGGGKETWEECAKRVTDFVVTPYFPQYSEPIYNLIREMKFLPGGRYLYAAGKRFSALNNCYLFRALDSREGWGNLMDKVTNALMTGGGIGVVYSDVRGEGELVGGMGGKSTGPCALMQMVNECGRHIMQGGSRRSAIWAGLHWSHPDIEKFIRLKNWDKLTRQGKEQNFNYPAPMDCTNISVILDTEFHKAYRDVNHPKHEQAVGVYRTTCFKMLSTAEPGFSSDMYGDEGENLRNACTEVTSFDDSDMCNLGSLNLGRITNSREFKGAVELGTVFLLCGTLASKLPLAGMYEVRERTRRLGLGLMGLHEWLLKRGYKYGENPELKVWMEHYRNSGAVADFYADKLGISRPVKTRAVAPTGTISIIAETTSGIEPIYAVAQKRRYLDGKEWKAQYIIDATAQRLIEEGVAPDTIEDAVTLSEDVERRIAFQAFVQDYVDHGISSTINLPKWGSPNNNGDTVDKFASTLFSYLPRLRGITAYPDGCRGGQPLNRVEYADAIDKIGVEFVDQSEEGCVTGVCGL